MSRRRKKPSTRSSGDPSHARSEAAGGTGRAGGSSGGDAGGSSKGGVGKRVSYKRSVLRFVAVLGGCMVVFNVWFFLSFSKGETFKSYLALNAEASALVLRVFGDEATAIGSQISSSRYSVDIQRGCEAIQVSALYIFAVLAWPLTVSRGRRLAGLAVGTALLLLLNLVRIVSLYYTGVYFPRAFETMHIDVWQPAFIVIALVIWAVWLSWASRAGAVGAHAVA